MSLEEIATDGLKVAFDNTAPGVPPLSYNGDLSVDDVKIIVDRSPQSKIDGKPICRTSATMVFTAVNVCPHTFTGHTFVAGGGTVLAFQTNAKDDLLNVVRKRDTGGCVGSWTNNSSGAVVPCACNVEISESGQDGEVNGD